MENIQIQLSSHFSRGHNFHIQTPILYPTIHLTLMSVTHVVSVIHFILDEGPVL